MTEEHIHTAGDLAADNNWMIHYFIRIKGGRTIYSNAVFTSRGKVRLSRLGVSFSTKVEREENWLAGVHQIDRYVPAKTEMELVPMDEYLDDDA
jgi:hypothetical protein